MQEICNVYPNHAKVMQILLKIFKKYANNKIGIKRIEFSYIAYILLHILLKYIFFSKFMFEVQQNPSKIRIFILERSER